jgi:hypothetical protein
MGRRRKRNPAYKNRQGKIRWVRTSIAQETNPETMATRTLRIEALSQPLRKRPRIEPCESQDKRRRSLRDADDCILGIIGSTQDAQEVMKKVCSLLRQEVPLESSKETSGIRHRKKGSVCLGDAVRRDTNDKSKQSKVHGTPTNKRTVCEKLDRSVPEATREKVGASKGYGTSRMTHATRRAARIRLSDLAIVSTSHAERRGLAHSSALAEDAKQKRNKLQDLWQGSVLRTLADTHTTSVTKPRQRLRYQGDLVVRDRRGKTERTRSVFDSKQRKKTPTRPGKVALFPSPFGESAGTARIQRDHAQQCAYGGKEKGYCEGHQVKKRSDLKSASDEPA